MALEKGFFREEEIEAPGQKLTGSILSGKEISWEIKRAELKTREKLFLLEGIWVRKHGMSDDNLMPCLLVSIQANIRFGGIYLNLFSAAFQSMFLKKAAM